MFGYTGKCLTVIDYSVMEPESRKIKIKVVGPIENDLKSMGVKRWRKIAEDRSIWAIIL
jgi:hypothetical protein